MKRRGLLREVLASGAGKLGVAMALVLGVAALVVLATFPLDFGPSALVGSGRLGRLPQGRAARLERGLLGQSPGRAPHPGGLGAQ